MNFLAHLHLAGRTPESRLGNLLGDFVRGLPWDDRFPRAIWEGIVMHRAIDAFTDNHPDWKRSRDRLSSGRRRYAGIIIDVFYDHFLARHWEKFSSNGESLHEFVGRCHADLRKGRDQTPPEVIPVFERMAAEDWLGSYREKSGISRALDRISRRSDVLGPVRGSIAELEGNFSAMEADFLTFYPELMAYAAELRLEGGL